MNKEAKKVEQPKNVWQWIAIYAQMLILTIETLGLRALILWMNRKNKTLPVAVRHWVAFGELRRGTIFLTPDGRIGVKCETNLVAPVLPSAWETTTVYIRFDDNERVHEVDPQWLIRM